MQGRNVGNILFLFIVAAVVYPAMTSFLCAEVFLTSILSYNLTGLPLNPTLVHSRPDVQ